MLVCNIDMLFIFVVVGWPGTAHDSHILSSMIEEMKRWHILCDMQPFSLIKQQKIIVATTTLHNFIRMCGVEDGDFNKCDVISEYMIERVEESNIYEEISSYNLGRVQDGGHMNRVRNQIGVVSMESRNV